MESFQDLCRQLIHFSWQILLGKTQDRLFCCVDKKDISSSGTTMMHIVDHLPCLIGADVGDAEAALLLEPILGHQGEISKERPFQLRSRSLWYLYWQVFKCVQLYCCFQPCFLSFIWNFLDPNIFVQKNGTRFCAFIFWKYKNFSHVAPHPSKCMLFFFCKIPTSMYLACFTMTTMTIDYDLTMTNLVWKLKHFFCSVFCSKPILGVGYLNI